MAITKNDITSLLSDVESDAKELGLLQPYHKLWYNAGSRVNGISPEITVHVVSESGMHRDFGAGDFLPEFGYKATSTDVYSRLSTVLKVLEAVIRKQA